MDISCSLNPKQALIFPVRKSFLKSPRFNTISCGASTLETQRAVTSTNYYELLSLESKNVGVEDIKKAYRSMARQYHPDVVPASRREESTRRFVEVQKAYETLSNPISRQKYDFELGYLSRCGATSEDGRPNFNKDVWADQISGLEFKSKEKKIRKKRAAACI
ncbi:hypothetical protein ACHQM5_022404 [Ranunculus cassubicifolius]